MVKLIPNETIFLLSVWRVTKKVFKVTEGHHVVITQGYENITLKSGGVIMEGVLLAQIRLHLKAIYFREHHGFKTNILFSENFDYARRFRGIKSTSKN